MQLNAALPNNAIYTGYPAMIPKRLSLRDHILTCGGNGR